MCGEKFFLQICIQIIPDHNIERITKIGARLTKLSQQSSLALALSNASLFSEVSNLQGK